MATIIPAQTGATSWSNPTGVEGGHFRPNGRLTIVSSEDDVNPNLSTWRATGSQTMAARLFVGFNVGGKAKWSMEDLIHVVRSARAAQDERQDASFVAQKGIYTHTVPGHRPKVIEEKGAQVILIRMPGEPEKAFRKHMMELAEAIADRLQQAEVVLELQRAGVTIEVMGVAP